MKRYTLLLIGVLLALLVALVGGGKPAQAAYPGQNGKIIFVRAGTFITIDPNGENEIELAATGSEPVWSPDGTRIAYVDWRYTGSITTTDIAVVDADGQSSTLLTRTDGVWEYGPTWSPDGKMIAFYEWNGSNFSIWVMNADGTNKRALTQHTNDTYPAWSPDGKKIAFRSTRDNAFELYVMNPDGSHVERLTYNSRLEEDPNWSPDGNRIVFAGLWDNNWEIGVIDADGSDEVRLTYNLDSEDARPAWSPDGSKIVFEHVDDVYIMNPDGTDQTQLVQATTPTWSPDPNWQPIATITDFSPTNDAYVSQAKPKAGYGTKPALQVKDAAKDVNAYLKFNVSGLDGAVKLAVLRLYVANPGPDGGAVYAVSPFYKNTTTLWLETGLKWNNAPTISGAPLDAAGNAVKRQWVELDVTSAVVAALGDNGRVSLALTNDSNDLVIYSSKEGAHPPELVVVTN